MESGEELRIDRTSLSFYWVTKFGIGFEYFRNTMRCELFWA